MNDLRFAVRQLLKNPGFTVVAVLTLALGIGANTALFTAIDTILFRPLMARSPDRLVYVANDKEEAFSFPFYERLRDAVHCFDGCAAAQWRAPQRELTVPGAEGETDAVSAQGVTGNSFDVLGVPPLLGRTLVAADDLKGNAQPVVVISHAFWKQRFGGDPGVIGLKANLENVPVTIIGVMPPGFVGFEADVRPDLWWPLQFVSQLEQRDHNPLGEGVSWLVLFGRLQNGITPKQAQTEVSVFFRRQLEDQISSNPKRPQAQSERLLRQSLTLLPGIAGYIGARSEFSRPLGILMSAVGTVLLIACMNIAGLLLVRGMARQREFAVRAALGADRRRIIRQLLVESVLFALMGGATGLLLARAGTVFLSGYLAQSSTPVQLTPDLRALFFTLTVSLLAGMLFGLLPALRLSRFDLVTAIKNQGGNPPGRSSARLQPLLVIAQVALSVVLLTTGGLFLRTVRNLRSIPFGFRRDHLVCLAVDFGRQRPDASRRDALLRRLVTELETVPGVSSASIGGAGLLTGNGITMDIAVDDYTPAPGEEMRVSAILAGPRFFETMQVPLLSGRALTSADEPPPGPAGTPSHATVAVIGEQMARRFFGTFNPIGRHFTVDSTPKVRLEIVGVAKDTRYSSNLRARTPFEFYVPFFGSGIRMPPTFYLRTDQPAEVMAHSIGGILTRIEPQLKIHELRSMDEVIDHLLLRERILAQILGFFSGSALLLTCLGVYGILSFRVVQRAREIGVRMALGASIGNVVRDLIGRGLALVVIGGIVGMAVALVATRFVESLLYGLTPADPPTFAVVMGLLLAAAGLASWLPAWRAARVDPMQAIRND
jgi:predicted permease